MRGFDVLDPALPLFQNHFLEASAGTGKTFAIENLFVRLLNEGVALEEILVVTFTRAATVELKERIRSRLSAEQLVQFDEAKVWTIHSFCFHCLQEHALQTGFALDKVEESGQSDILKEIIKDALRTTNALTPKQLEKVLNDSLLNRLAALVGQRLPIEQPDWNFPKFQADPDKLFEDLIALAPQYKNLCDRQQRVKPETAEGLKRFTRWIAGEAVDPVDLPIIHYTPENMTKRNLSASLHNPGLLVKMQEELIPKLASFSNSEHILAVLAEEARLHLERVVEEEDLLFFEDLLRKLAKQVEEPAFAQTVRSQYRAVLIDEFQDTDPLQWKIFSTLFLHEKFEGPVYLVGDPKQSIYRFRSADLYTYMEAKRAMGENAHASLETNYRSCPQLVEELNELFTKTFIFLPKTGEAIPCPPVEAASSLEPIADGKGSLHFLVADNEEILFSTIVHEIDRLNLPLSSFAVLVSDRHQAERFMKACPLPCVSKRSRSLLDSPAFPTLLELIRAAQNPRDRSAAARVLGGPLFGYPLTPHQLSDNSHTLSPHLGPQQGGSVSHQNCPYPAVNQSATTGERFVQRSNEKCGLNQIPEEFERFYRYRHLLETEGLLALFNSVVEESNLSDPRLYQEMLQLVEMGAHIKEDYVAFYHKLMQLDPDSDQLRARAVFEEEAIQVMTIHVSKGLEFSVVFPIGIAAPYKKQKGIVRSDNRLVFSDPLSEAETRSEKMRQLYVACTRAKQRLYIPVVNNDSPVTTFLENVDITQKSHEICRIYPSPVYQKKGASKLPALRLAKSYTPFAFHSYTSLTPYEAGEKITLAEGSMPAGPETGRLIHQLFENFSFEKGEIHRFVRKELRGTFLEPWSDEAASMMEWALNVPLPAPEGSFPLSAVDPKKMIKEMEFLFPTDEPPGFFKGFIDLFFEYEGGYYFIDWKTNVIGTSIEETIRRHRYDLQAEIYQRALKRYLKIFHNESELKGIFYIFFRFQEVYFFFNKN
ncbi:MAG: UvrD-helicase domain-containing protein [Chlamydiales bacterium]|nr:UvrD-helicase domain-containing protein [Chlamydiales bacterium]